jgi:hypothetical protein
VDMNRLNGKTFKAAVYLFPFFLMLCACVNFILIYSHTLQPSSYILFITFHLLFLLSLATVCGNLTIELALIIFEDIKKSSLKKLLYSDRRFLPIRPAVFIAVFIVLYVFLLRFVAGFNQLEILIFFVPTVAIFMNAPHFISGRVRFINGRYVFYKGSLNAIFSYQFDEKGTLVFITDDGSQLRSGATAADTDFKALEAEFFKNGLNFSGKK